MKNFLITLIFFTKFILGDESNEIDYGDIMQISFELKDEIIRPKHDSDWMMKKLQNFNDGFREWIKLVHRGDKYVMWGFDCMKERQGPYHLTLFPVDMLFLVRYYKWDHYDCWRFGKYLEEGKNMWLELKEFVKNRNREQLKKV
uniref:Uncharacterized protein n=1 Tax=Cuerna arida TaxID=1464854 RepID=A0A1B6EP62_9HEMI